MEPSATYRKEWPRSRIYFIASLDNIQFLLHLHIISVSWLELRISRFNCPYGCHLMMSLILTGKQ